MTPTEIKALIAAKIAGQGTMVDAGGALPAILDAIADAIATIPAAQVQSDWTQVDDTKVDFIKNKPTIPAAPVQSDWTESDSSSLAYIKHKPTIFAPKSFAITSCNDGEQTGTKEEVMQACGITVDLDEILDPAQNYFFCAASIDTNCILTRVYSKADPTAKEAIFGLTHSGQHVEGGQLLQVLWVSGEGYTVRFEEI